jgi:hypothetical protein
LDEFRSHSPAKYYAAFLLTSGLFGFYWLISLMRDVNVLSGAERFDFRKISRVLIVLGLIEMIGVVYLMTSSPGSAPRSVIAIIVMVALALSASPLFLAVRINKIMIQLAGTTASSASTLKIVLLTLAWYLSLPFLQSKINAIGRSREAATGHPT